MTAAQPRATVPPMARVKIRYFTARPGAAGPRYFWQPAAALRVHGWRLQRLSDDKREAVAKAMALNAELDAWRSGTLPLPLPGVAAPLPVVEPQTLAHVIRVYKADRIFTELRPRTKRSYQQNMRFLEDWGGDKRVAAVTHKVVESLYVSLRQRTPAKAAAVITMLRILLGVALREGWVTANAASGANIKGAKPSGRIWPREAVRLFVAAADAAGWHSIGTAVMINHWAGQRECDVLELPRTNVAGSRLRVTQSKTGARVDIPDNPAVRARIDAELARQEARAAAAREKGATLLPSATLLLCETTGLPWTEHYFRHVFADIRTALAADHPTIAHADGTIVETAKLLMMHLRHTAITELAIAGATPLQIAGITGHSINSINSILSRHYLSLTGELANEAAAKRTAYDARQIPVA